MRTSSLLRCWPAWVGLFIGCAVVVPVCRADAEPGARSVAPTEVRVERVRPKREKHPTLRFLKANRDFIRARLDLLREAPGKSLADASAIDPRFLAYGELMQSALAGTDSVRASEDLRQRRELFTSVTELGQLESQLDQLERLLGAQRTRLTALQADFTGHQRTELAVVARGLPVDATVLSFTLTLEDGAPVTVTLSDAQRQSLREGGAVELFHGLVEPRDQVVALTLTGSRWPAGDSGYVSITPARDRLTFLQLDFSALQPEQGTTSLRASTWLLERVADLTDGAGAQP